MNDLFQICVDDSAALIKSSVITFANCASVKEYLSKCFSVLHGNIADLPRCLIRLDTFHFLRSLKRIPCLKSADINVRKFYISAFIALMECDDFAKAKKMLQELSLVCQSKVDNRDVKKSVNFIGKECQRNKMDDVAYSEDDGENLFEETLLDEEAGNDCDWFVEFRSEKTENESEIENGKNNILFLPALQKNIVELAKRLPLWTAVMKNSFNSAHNLQNQGNAESAFNLIKNVVFSNVHLPIRADQFVKDHINSINGYAKHMMTKQKGEERVLALERSKDPAENWMNQTKIAERKRINALPNTIQMLSNTYLNRRRRHAPYFKQMCAFNSIVHALSCAFLDSQNLKEHLKELIVDEDGTRKTTFLVENVLLKIV